ncbi:hypothetical protein [Mesorhizobium sp. M0633]|uniref:hypothetical protein n=1 Tax=Mesorhizobium sp. M0633 TaxID=2956977 RepID=UPI00333BDE90
MGEIATIFRSNRCASAKETEGKHAAAEPRAMNRLRRLIVVRVTKVELHRGTLFLSACSICQAHPAHSDRRKKMKRILLASAVLAVSAGPSFAQTTSGTSSGTSTSGTSTTTTMPSTTDQGTGTTSSGTNMSGDQGTDTTTTSGTTNPNSARDCAPGQQTGSAQQAAPGQQDTAANTAAPGQVKKTDEGC